MELQYETVEQLASVMVSLIDSYWKLEISEEDFLSQIAHVFLEPNLRGIAMRGLNFKSAFERKLGKKRIAELTLALIKIDKKTFQGLKK